MTLAESVMFILNQCEFTTPFTVGDCEALRDWIKLDVPEASVEVYVYGEKVKINVYAHGKAFWREFTLTSG